MASPQGRGGRRPPFSLRGAGIVLALLIMVGILYQASATTWRSVEPARQVWRAIGKSGFWRGVNFSAGQEFANYLEFLDQALPKDAQVILPPDGVGPPAISRTPYMQFFLAPRQVANCTSQVTSPSSNTSALPGEDCAINASKAGAYVLVVQNDHYPATLATNPEQLHLYNQNLGVYFPAGAQFAQAPASGNSSLLQIAASLFWPGAWLFVLSGAGLMIVTFLAPDWRLAGRAALGYGLGIGGLALLLYAALLLGFGFSRALLFGLTLLWACAGALAYFALRKTQPANKGQSWEKVHSGEDAQAGEGAHPAQSRWSWSALIYILLFAGLAGLAAVLSIGMGFHWGDEVILWGVKGYGIASLGLSPGVSEWGTRTTSYPLNLPLLIAAFRVAFGDGLPESKILFPLFYFCQLLLVFDFLRDLIPDWRGVHLAGWLTLAYAATPLIFTHASLAYANLPLTFYLSAAVIAAGRAINSIGSGATPPSLWRKGLLLSGVFFALAAWTRPEGLALSALAALCCAWFLLRQVGKGQRLTAVLALAGPLAGYALLWGSTSGLVYQQGGWSDVKMRAGLAQILSGNLNLESSLFVLRSFLAGFVDVKTWGIVGLSLVALIVLTLFLFQRLNTAARPKSTICCS